MWLNDFGVLLWKNWISQNRNEPVVDIFCMIRGMHWKCGAIFPENGGKSPEWCLLYDRRGYGKSSRHLTVHQRNKMPACTMPMNSNPHYGQDEYSKAVLYGHSDGASIALVRQPTPYDRFGAIMLEGTHEFIEEAGKPLFGKIATEPDIIHCYSHSGGITVIKTRTFQTV